MARIGADAARRLGLADGDRLTVSGATGSVTLPVRVTAMPDRVVWLPMRSPGSDVRTRPRHRAGRRRAAVGSPGTTGGAAMNLLATANQPTLEDFGHDVWWIVLIKVVGIFAVLVLLTLFAIVFERKVVARMQQRIGPNRVGPRGYLQSLADGLKLAFKEDIMPALADKPVYFLAPIIACIPAFLAFSVIPLGPTVSHLRRADARCS